MDCFSGEVALTLHLPGILRPIEVKGADATEMLLARSG